jgi:L-serine dehydratase
MPTPNVEQNSLERAPSQIANGPVRTADLFKIGIGPSSSHTVGPMKAACTFAHNLEPLPARIKVTLFGSLAWTGKGHATDKAIILGLSGRSPDQVDPDEAEDFVLFAKSQKNLKVSNRGYVSFDPDRDIVFDTTQTHLRHPNTMQFATFDEHGEQLCSEVWFSIGGGFVVREDNDESHACLQSCVPHPYSNGRELLAAAKAADLRIADLVFANETSASSTTDIIESLDRILSAMAACIDRGLGREGELPGGLRVRRRAKSIHDKLRLEMQRNLRSPHESMEYVSVFAMAVNEENAAGGRVVTAPTNGAAGVVPAVLRYYRDFCAGATPSGMRDFLLTATAIGGIIKQNASISGAEVGCQGEVGSAAAMAAGGLVAALGGSNEQIENAAEIAIEHHLGMTCDPVGGLVQIPCIERNAFGAIKAINAALLAMRGDGTHIVSLDQAIETMRQTGNDMQTKYKETSLGGLAVNVTEC